ncbi:MAG: serine/threonine protein kinase, partial [Gammaproteobacteria bacterium]|nr:serine/threonine protein kinase [Gammaproteobacteria bacterium]
MLDLSKGTRLADRYTLERRLARGGEAETWLAQDRLTGAAVALKIVGGEADAADRLKQEWQTNIRLMHAHIARVFEFHDDAGAAFYTQQYIDGPDLSALSGKPLDQLLAPVGLIADALRYAHSKGVVHRDIKASNILLDRNGAPYLADFGVSAPVGAQTGGGSAIAQSPQSLAGEAVAPSDDVFALGGLIYELVSGRSPYSSADPLADIQGKTPDALRSSDGVPVPAAVQRLVASMLEKDAALRPSAEQVAAGLREAGFAPGTAQIEIASHRPLADEQLQSAEAIRPASRPAVTTDSLEQSAPPSGVSPRTLGIALGALLLLLLGVVFLLPQTVNTDPEDLSVLQPASPGPGRDVRPARDIDSNGEPVLGERREQREFLPESRGIDGEEILFNENAADFSGLDDAEKARY